jgi:hypothetical protein
MDPKKYGAVAQLSIGFSKAYCRDMRAGIYGTSFSKMGQQSGQETRAGVNSESCLDCLLQNCMPYKNCFSGKYHWDSQKPREPC